MAKPSKQDDQRVREEAAEAAREAGEIGGRTPTEGVPDAERPVREGGGGEAEGYEQAEKEHIEGASHGDPSPDPTEHAGEPEGEPREGESR